MPIHDSSAMAYVIDPTLFETKHVYTDVDHQASTTTARPSPTGAASANGTRTSTSPSTSTARFLDMYQRRLTEARP